MYRNLASLYTTHACREYRSVFAILERECGYSEHNIPQLEHVSNFLRSTSSPASSICLITAKFHYTDTDTGPCSGILARTRQRARTLSVSGPCRALVRVRVVEFSYIGVSLSWCMSADRLWRSEPVRSSSLGSEPSSPSSLSVTDSPPPTAADRRRRLLHAVGPSTLLAAAAGGPPSSLAPTTPATLSPTDRHKKGKSFPILVTERWARS